MAIALFAGCSSSADKPARDPDSVPISIKSVEVLGPGAKNAESSKDKTADAALGPVRSYYDGAFFKVELPAQDFAKAFDGFTPTIAVVAQGVHKSTLTPDDPSIAALWAERLDAKVSLYADSEGAVEVGIIKVAMVGGGRLIDGLPVSISHVDDFYVVKSKGKWVVTGYAVRQDIDAPPMGQVTETASPVSPPATSPSATTSPSGNPTKSPTKGR